MSGPYCEDCLWYRRPSTAGLLTDARCANPSMPFDDHDGPQYTQGALKISSRLHQVLPRCTTLRNDERLCGLVGRGFARGPSRLGEFLFRAIIGGLVGVLIAVLWLILHRL